MFDRVEDLEIGSLAWVYDLNCLAIIIGINEETYTVLDSYGKKIEINKKLKMSFRSEDLRKDNAHYLDMGLYAVTIEKEIKARKMLKEAEEDKVKYLKRIVDNPPEFR